MNALKGKRILIVDDEPDICEAVADDLSAWCDVDTASTAAGAREKLAAGGYDVAVLDIMGVDGWELLAEYAATLPCIILTAHALTVASEERAKREGAALFLAKAEMAHLDRHIARMLVSRRSERVG